jgi:capsular polysaccharide export protein
MFVFFSAGDFLDVFCGEMVRRLTPARWVQTSASGLVLHNVAAGRSTSTPITVNDLPAAITGRCLIVWNGLLPWYAPAVAAAQAQGMRVCYMENGLISGRVQMDPRGVNAGSGLADLPSWWFRGYPSADDIWETPFTQRAIELDARQEPLPADAEPLPDRYLFLPLQIDPDTQITRYSPWYHTMADVLRALLSVLPAGYRLVVKEHPSAKQLDPAHVPYSTFRPQFPEVVWCRTRTVEELIHGAAAVITVNSSVGVHALCRRKPLLVLGQAVYGKPGIAQVLTDPTALGPALQATLDGEIDHALRASFLTYLRDRWLVPWDYDLMEARIRAIADGVHPWYHNEWGSAHGIPA